MNVSTGHAGPRVRSDLAWRKLRNHNTATTLVASSAPQHPLTHAWCFRPSRPSLVSKWKESKKSGKNECIKEKADTMNQARGSCTQPLDTRQEEAGGLWEKPLEFFLTCVLCNPGFWWAVHLHLHLRGLWSVWEASPGRRTPLSPRHWLQSWVTHTGSVVQEPKPLLLCACHKFYTLS